MDRDRYDSVLPMSLRSVDPDDTIGSNGHGMGAFELEEDEELLLDWAQYNHLRTRWSCCGIDCSWLAKILPRSPFTAPECWQRLSPVQRTATLAASGCGAILLLVLVLVLSLRGGHGMQQHVHVPHVHRTMAAGDSPYCSWDQLYLPTGVVPKAYTVSLSTDMQPPYAVNGSIHITLEAKEATPCIVLHSKAINITAVRLLLGDNTGTINGTINGSVYNRSLDNDQVTLLFDEVVPQPPEDLPVLELEFSYVMQEGLDGFYRSTYHLDDGSEHIVASTQFESIAARKAFPCFDEPSYKATWEVSLATPASMVTLANMPLAQKQDLPDGLMNHTYQPTPPMSSYLVAFVVGELASVSKDCATMNGNTPMAVYATPDRKGQLNTALNVACKAIQTFEGLLEVPFALPKLDLVGVPNFAAGAMENWGLLTYRETALLVDESKQDIQQEFYIGTVVSHEVSHQWFGDLVTLDDWTELWLNEGFASYLENVGADAYNPAGKYFDFFFNSQTTTALELDASNTSHPLSINRPIKSLNEIDNWFDDISYDKGGAVLRMLRAYLNRDGPNEPTSRGDLRLRRRQQRRLAAARDKKDPFMSALTHYLKDRQFGNANFSQLWTLMGEAAGQPVADWMSVWTLRRAYPIVMASQDANAGNQAITLDQFPYSLAVMQEIGIPISADRYCDDFTSNIEESSWWIPLSYTTSDDALQNRPLRWQTFSKCSVQLDTALPANGWVLLNAGRFGYYRVNYSEPLWGALEAAVQHKEQISGVDFAGLLDDAYSLSQARQLSPTIFLRLSVALGRRFAPEYAPWDIALGWFQRMRDILATAALTEPKWAQCAEALTTYVTNNLTAPFIANVAIPGQDTPGLTFTVDTSQPPEIRMLRPMVLLAAGFLGHKEVLQRAVGLLDTQGVAGVHADVASAVFGLAVLSGDEEVYTKVQDAYIQASDAVEEAKLLHALARAPTPDLITRTLEFALSPEVRSQDIGSLVAGVAKAGGVPFKMTWDFVTTNIDRILERFPGKDATYSFGRRLTPLNRLFTDPAMVAQLEAFDAAHPGILAPTFLDGAHEAVTNNLDWLQAQGEEVCTWLRG